MQSPHSLTSRLSPVVVLWPWLAVALLSCGSTTPCAKDDDCPMGQTCAVDVMQCGPAMSQPTLTVTQMGGGPGLVVSDPAGINCGSACTASYSPGAKVTLTAIMQMGGVFQGWGGACSVKAATCTLTLGGPTSVTAAFTRSNVHTLTVIKGGDGSGTVVSQPAGINCGGTCTGVYMDGVTVVLTAAPAAGSAFGGWAGGNGVCSGTADCTLKLTEDVAVQAYFGTYVTVPSGTMADLRALHGTSAKDIWAAGAAGTVLHYDGMAWTKAASMTARDLYGLWAHTASDLWVVGAGGTVLHGNGASFTAATAGAADLRGVSGSGTADVWAVGAGGVIQHYDGSKWTQKASNTTANLRAVWSNGPADAWAVGETATVLHWDGTSWKKGAADSQIGTDNLSAVWGSAPVWIGGDNGDLAQSGGGLTFSSVTSDDSDNINGLWGSGPGDVFAVGDMGAAQHFDGKTWTSLTTLASVNLHGVFGGGPKDLWLAGDMGTLIHHQGQ